MGIKRFLYQRWPALDIGGAWYFFFFLIFMILALTIAAVYVELRVIELEKGNLQPVSSLLPS